MCETPAMDLGSLLDPTSTAVLTMELQRGVVGDLAALSHLRDAAALVSMPANAGRICALARSAGATVVHCTAEFRPDRKDLPPTPGSWRLPETQRRPARSRAARHRADPGVGSRRAILLVPSHPWVTPFVATELDQLLRNCGIRTVWPSATRSISDSRARARRG